MLAQAKWDGMKKVDVILKSKWSHSRFLFLSILFLFLIFPQIHSCMTVPAPQDIKLQATDDFSVQHPDVFGNCGAFSPAVWLGDLIEQYEASPVFPVKIYMDAGSYEPSIYNSAITLKAILDDDQWNLRWRAWHEGHSWGAWRAHLDEALTFFWPMVTSGIDDRY